MVLMDMLRHGHTFEGVIMRGFSLPACARLPETTRAGGRIFNRVGQGAGLAPVGGFSIGPAREPASPPIVRQLADPWLTGVPGNQTLRTDRKEIKYRLYTERSSI